MAFFNKPKTANESSNVSAPLHSHLEARDALHNSLQSPQPPMDKRPQSSNGLVTPPISVANPTHDASPMVVDDTGGKRSIPWNGEDRKCKVQRTSNEENPMTLDIAHTAEDRNTHSAVTWQSGNNRIANVFQMSHKAVLSTSSVIPRPLPGFKQLYTMPVGRMPWNDQIGIQKRQSRPKLKLADFHVLRTLGTGSFGRVRLIQSRVNNRYYAVKVLKKKEIVRLKQVEHTINEKNILESVSHPFLVNMWGTFQDDTNLYMVMDYVRGGELFSILRKQKRFPENVAKFYAAEIFLALEYLHNKDIIYRDLKPENLLLDANGHIKMTDFGFAKHVPDITWTLCGTPDYLAPEIIQSKGYGKAVDWWSFGILIFELLAGYPPFYDNDGDHMKLYERITKGHVKWPKYFSPSAVDLLKRLLTADLSKRYGNLKDGSKDIRCHPWFAGVDFEAIRRQATRGPNVPNTHSDGDTSYFDKYPEPEQPYGAPDEDPYRELFSDF